MARVTVEDCVDKVPNRFRLVLYSAQRSRELSTNAPSCLDEDKIFKREKKTVLALREIASGRLDVDSLERAIIKGYRRVSDPEEEQAEGDLSEGDEARATRKPPAAAPPVTPNLPEPATDSPPDSAT